MKWPWLQEWRFSLGFANMDFHSPRQTWVQSLLSAQSANSIDQQWFPNMAPFSRVINQLPGNRLITLNCFHLEGPALCSYWNRQSRYGFAFPSGNPFTKTLIRGLTGCRIHSHSILYNISCDQTTCFRVNGVWWWAHAHRIHHVPHLPGAAGLIEHPFEYLVTVKPRLDGNTLQGRVMSSRRLYML